MPSIRARRLLVYAVGSRCLVDKRPSGHWPAAASGMPRATALEDVTLTPQRRRWAAATELQRRCGAVEPQHCIDDTARGSPAKGSARRGGKIVPERYEWVPVSATAVDAAAARDAPTACLATCRCRRLLKDGPRRRGRRCAAALCVQPEPREARRRRVIPFRVEAPGQRRWLVPVAHRLRGGGKPRRRDPCGGVAEVEDWSRRPLDTASAAAACTSCGGGALPLLRLRLLLPVVEEGPVCGLSRREHRPEVGAHGV